MMAKNTFTQWQTSDATHGHASRAFPLTQAPEPWFRDRLDATRSGRLPEADYPSGYLGTTRTRREDRLRQGGGNNTGGTEKSYARGIHVGSRVQPDAYFWSDAVSNTMGIELQAQGKKFAPKGEAIQHLVNDGKPAPVPGSASLRAHHRSPRARSV